MPIWPYFPLRTFDTLDDDIAEVNAHIITQVHVFIVGWIGEPLIQVHVQIIKTCGIISENDAMREGPLLEATRICQGAVDRFHAT